jgi:hypothetical protein
MTTQSLTPELLTVNNPLRMVAESLWDTLLRSSQVKDWFRPANRIMFYTGVDRTIQADQQPDKDEVGAGDLPEIRLVQTGMRPHAFRTSDRSSLEIEWALQVSTGFQHLGRLLDTEWIVWRALHLWEDTAKQLQWGEDRFVNSVRPLKVESSLTDKKANRGIVQWTDVWRVETRLWFTYSDLQGGI